MSLRINGLNCSNKVLFAQMFSVVLRETSRFLILNFVSFPLQEDFFWWEGQTWGGRLTKHPDLCRTQQCHTDKYSREQSMMGRGHPSPIQNILQQQHRARNTAGVFGFQCPYLHSQNNTRVDWLERTLTVLSFLLSFMKCLLHPRSLSVGHKRFILFFYYYFI